jgi:hypothetical protein
MSIEYEAWSAPEQVWTLWRGEKSVTLPGIEPRSPSLSRLPTSEYYAIYSLFTALRIAAQDTFTPHFRVECLRIKFAVQSASRYVTLKTRTISGFHFKGVQNPSERLLSSLRLSVRMKTREKSWQPHHMKTMYLRFFCLYLQLNSLNVYRKENLSLWFIN